MLDLTLGADPKICASGKATPEATEALRRWPAGCRVVNTHLFERKKVDGKTLITRKG